MKPEVQAEIAKAIAPLQKQIDDLREQVAALAKSMAPPPCVQEAQAVFNSIPRATVKALRVSQIAYDPKQVWFQLIRQSGIRISVRKQTNGFRLRVRDQSGTLLKEVRCALNGLNAALAALV
jgi:hypothetical protein